MTGQEASRPRASSVVHLASGAVAGAVQTVFWHPLDLLKTRLQVQDARVEASGRHGLPAYRSLAHAVRSIVHSEGLPGFLRGLLPNVAGSSLAWGIQMPLYAQLKWMASAESAAGGARSERSFIFFAPRDLCCSLTAGCFTNVIVHPIYLVKTRLQLQPRTRGGDSVDPLASRPLYRNSADAVARIVREEGAVALYRGFAASLLLSSHGAVLLASYDHFKALHPSTLVASFCAKVFATTATYPLQVMRSVMQQRPSESHSFPYTTLRRTAGILWQRGGPLAFYRGIWPQMMRTVPQAMAFFSIYECVLAAFTTHWDLT